MLFQAVGTDIELRSLVLAVFPVASAQESVKQAADIVVCDNNSGAISEIIDYIERR